MNVLYSNHGCFYISCQTDLEGMEVDNNLSSANNVFEMLSYGLGNVILCSYTCWTDFNEILDWLMGVNEFMFCFEIW